MAEAQGGDCPAAGLGHFGGAGTVGSAVSRGASGTAAISPSGMASCSASIGLLPPACEWRQTLSQSACFNTASKGLGTWDLERWWSLTKETIRSGIDQ